MWFVEWLLSILTYPIEWFWDKASVYKEEGKKGRVILLFALSLSGVVLFGYALIYGCIWIWYNHIEILVYLSECTDDQITTILALVEAYLRTYKTHETE